MRRSPATPPIDPKIIVPVGGPDFADTALTPFNPVPAEPLPSLGPSPELATLVCPGLEEFIVPVPSPVCVAGPSDSAAAEASNLVAVGVEVESTRMALDEEVVVKKVVAAI